jgi:pimeloyl-ACP methyl ester carboxylesterase
VNTSPEKQNYVDIGGIKFLVKTPKDVGVEVGEVKRIYWKKGEGRKLIVLLHGSSTNAQSFCYVSQIVHQELSDADLLIPEFPAGIFSTTDCLIVVGDVVRLIDWFEGQKKYNQIVLVGFSMGALLVRKVYVCACGEIEKAPFEKELAGFKQPKAWAQKVERIVLLAGTNRGWQISHHLSLPNAFIQSLGVVLGNLMTLVGRKPMLFNIRRGAPFITQLRIQWLAMLYEAPNRDVGDALTVQLLGSIDDVVSPEDNIDLVTGSQFIYLDVPKTGHFNILVMDDTPETDLETEERKKRAEMFRLALKGSLDDLKKHQLFPDEQQFPTRNSDVKHVVFVIHGIRDRGYWTKKIARKIRALGGNEIYATETSTYGYFPMLSFLLPFRRRDKMEWLMDQYSENLALYPDADFHFVGHSNGTYLLAQALREYPCCRFKHVVFAGSVVPVDYPWSLIAERRQVAKVLNFVATGDWVVAFFPKFFQVFPFMRWQGLGSAGHDGFKVCKDLPFLHPHLRGALVNGDILQVEYIEGDHGAALVEDNWETIADFIVSGVVENSHLSRLEPLLSKNQVPLISALSKVPYLVVGLILIIIIWLGWVVLSLNIAEWQKTVAFLLYLWLLWRVLTRL